MKYQPNANHNSANTLYLCLILVSWKWVSFTGLQEILTGYAKKIRARKLLKHRGQPPIIHFVSSTTYAQNVHFVCVTSIFDNCTKMWVKLLIILPESLFERDQTCPCVEKEGQNYYFEQESTSSSGLNGLQIFHICPKYMTIHICGLFVFRDSEKITQTVVVTTPNRCWSKAMGE